MAFGLSDIALGPVGSFAKQGIEGAIGQIKKPGERLAAGQRKLEQAQRRSVASRKRLFKESLEQLRPFREAGIQGLEALQRNIGPDSPLARQELERGNQFIGDLGSRINLGGRATEELRGEFGRGFEAREQTRQFGRLKDLTDIGRGFAASGAGALGAAGSSIGDIISRGSQALVPRFREQAIAAQVPLATGAQLAQRGLFDFATLSSLQR